MKFHEYHRGNLAADRSYDRELHLFASEVMGRAQRGEVYLVQRRIGFDRFSYLLVEC